MTSCTRFLAACALAAFASHAQAAEDDDGKAKVAVTLADVRAFPETYQRVPFDVALLYHGPRAVYNPFYTVFEPSSFLNFAAWSADAPVYSRDGFADDYPLFYVDRHNDALQRSIVAMRPLTWFTARCIVRSTAQDHAWIEVIAIPQAGPIMDPTDLRHLVRANVLAGNGEFERSLLEFEMARLLGAPVKFVARCRGEEGRVALAANQPERAAMALEQAFQWYPEDKQVATLLDQATALIASTRQREVASVPSSEPPPMRRHEPVVPRRTPPPQAPRVDPQAPAPKPAPVEPVTPEEEEPTPVVEDETPIEDESDGAPADDGTTEDETPTADDGSTDDETTSDDDATTEEESSGVEDEAPASDEPADETEAPVDGEMPADEETGTTEEVEDSTDGSEAPEDSEEIDPSEGSDDSADEVPADGTEEPEVEPYDPDADPDQETPYDPDADPDSEPVTEPDDGAPEDDPPPAPEDEPSTPPDGPSDGR